MCRVVGDTLQYNANVNVVDVWKFTPLHEAAAKGKYDICKLLLKVCVLHMHTCIHTYIHTYIHTCDLHS